MQMMLLLCMLMHVVCPISLASENTPGWRAAEGRHRRRHHHHYRTMQSVIVIVNHFKN